MASVYPKELEIPSPNVYPFRRRRRIYEEPTEEEKGGLNGSSFDSEPPTLPEGQPARSVQASQPEEKRERSSCSFWQIKGQERKCFLFMVQQCVSSGERITLPMTNQQIRDHLKISPLHVKKLIYRLSKKGCLGRVETERGRKGWVRFQLERTLYEECLEQLPCAASPEREADSHSPELPASSENEAQLELSYAQESSSIRIPPRIRYAGVGPSQIHQLVNQKKLSPVAIQNSLLGIEQDLRSGRIKLEKGVANFVMGLLLRGKPYVARSYEEEENKYQTQLEQQKTQDRLEQEKEEQKRKKAREQEQARAFQTWYEGSTSEERRRLLEPTELFPEWSILYRMSLKSAYFSKQGM